MKTEPTADQSKTKLPTVLIVEDNKPTMELLKDFFVTVNKKRHLECDTITANNGQEAIDLIDIAQPEIVLCDINMPIKDGFEVLSHFNDWSRKNNQYCFFCFFSNAEEEKARAFKAGVDGFLAKKILDYYPLTLQLRAWLKLVAFERKYAK
ncbi:MAG: response regulator [SAR324 cluster bacterium]|nr:response regulator [SAR324 cluster bacterium]